MYQCITEPLRLSRAGGILQWVECEGGMHTGIAVLSTCPGDGVIQGVWINTSCPQGVLIIVVSYWCAFILLEQIKYNPNLLIVYITLIQS